MDCPVCKLPLIVIERQQIELDYCLTCKGLWFDTGELELLFEKYGMKPVFPGIATAAGSHEKPRPCPRCRQEMDKVHVGSQPQVLLDRCTNGDGLWFDGGELGTIMNQYIGFAVEPGEQTIINFLGETFGTEKKRADKKNQ